MTLPVELAESVILLGKALQVELHSYWPEFR